ncbi:MAG TPA: class I SAM-dependent methyltransferase [Dermatophilaceae bacterium]|nr:class I SAM-dependent methyltransferase [Dermatophilaceae bacterium]
MDIAAYWDDYAQAYDREPDHGLGDPATRAAWRELLRSCLPGGPADVVDLACGTGSLTALAAELGHRVTGVDIAQQMLRRARAKTAGMPVRLVRGEVADPRGLPMAGFDVVLARHILWTLPDPHAALRRWAGLLRPGGSFVLVEGRWSSVGDDGYPGKGRLPWAGGVRATDLTAAVLPLVDPGTVQVWQLDQAVLWGRPVGDERYLLLARVPAAPVGLAAPGHAEN